MSSRPIAWSRCCSASARKSKSCSSTDRASAIARRQGSLSAAAADGVSLTIGKSAVAPSLGNDRHAAEAEPLPVVLLRRGPVSPRALGTLHTDARLELLVTDEMTPEWSALSERVAGLVVATEHD